MARQGISAVHDQEIVAIGTVFDALRNLDPAAQERVLDYVAQKLGVVPQGVTKAGTLHSSETATQSPPGLADEVTREDDGLEGISPVARKWIARNGLNPNELSSLFSLGVDEIDLVAKTVPGSSKREKVRSVLLLKGAAAYLSAGIPRITHEQVKEACLHYDAYDSTNFSKYLKSMASEMSGDKEAGYTLTARGLTAATTMIKESVSRGEN